MCALYGKFDLFGFDKADLDLFGTREPKVLGLSAFGSRTVLRLTAHAQRRVGGRVEIGVAVATLKRVASGLKSPSVEFVCARNVMVQRLKPLRSHWNCMD